MDLPAEMTAIFIEGRGGPEVLAPRRIPVPAVKAGEILIRVVAAGVNRPDAMQREGLYPPPEGAPEWPGLEVAGEVAALGEGAEGHALGDRVMALLPGGGYAEYAAVHATNAIAVPPSLSFTEAAAIPETLFTVWHNVFQRGGLASGESLLVHGGTSGIGTTAIQLARAFGARVFATAGSDEKCRFAEKLGAERCVNYREGDFVELLRQATNGVGVDVILDMVGGDYTNRNLKLAALEGRVVQIAFLKGPKVELDLTPLMLKRLTFTGSTLRPRSIAFKGALAAELSKQALPLYAERTVAAQIEATFPLQRASDAHRLLEADHVGKIVLIVDHGE